MDPNIKVVIKNFTEDAPRLIAIASKITLSKKPLDSIVEISEEEIEKWIYETYRRFHFSPWEHVSYTFIVDGLSRVASHQLVRHRIASYTQMSHRHTEGFLKEMAENAVNISRLNYENPENKFETYSKALEYIKSHSEKIKIASIGFVPPKISEMGLEIWADTVIDCASKYYLLLSKGHPMEEARYVLPDSVRTRIIVTMNARELIQTFLPLRMCSRAQWEIRYIAWKLWEELMKLHPQIWKYAGPSCVLRENTIKYEPKPLKDYLEEKEKFSIERCPELVKKESILRCLKESFEILKS